MTLKLPHSSGNSVSITAPASNPAADRSLALPGNADGTILTTKYPSGIQVLEQFFCPCDGSTIATSDGDITIVDKDDAQALTTSYADVLGSNISYNPPAGTTQVIYEYHFYGTRDDDDMPVGHFKFFIDSDEVTDARSTFGASLLSSNLVFKWGINIGGSAVTATGRQTSWSSAKTLKLSAREFGSAKEAILNQTYHWDGGASNQFHRPQIGITAIGG